MLAAMIRTRAFARFVLVAGVFAGCGSDSSTPAAPTTPPPAPAPAPAPPPAMEDGLMPTLSSIQSRVFDPRCVEHHGGHAVEAGLDLSAGMSHQNLVDAPSTQAGMDLVEPGDPENSYLIHKLENRTGIVGGRMPPSGDPLTAEEIEVIRQWIAAGAPSE
jgi:hypothetical protein